MKKIICFLLGICMVVSFAACGGKKTSSEPEAVDVEYYAKLGKMPECEYALGSGVDQTQEELNAVPDADFHSVLDVIEGERTVLITTSGFDYYYMKESKDSGISYIVNYGTAYGFDEGTVIVTVRDALSAFEADEHDAGADELFFLPSAENCSCLSYTFGKNTVMFVFQDNALCATVIYDPAKWMA